MQATCTSSAAYSQHSTRDYSSVHTQQPAGPIREYKIDPYILLEDELKYVFEDIRQVNLIGFRLFYILLRRAPLPLLIVDLPGLKAPSPCSAQPLSVLGEIEFSFCFSIGAPACSSTFIEWLHGARLKIERLECMDTKRTSPMPLNKVCDHRFFLLALNFPCLATRCSRQISEIY